MEVDLPPCVRTDCMNTGAPCVPVNFLKIAQCVLASGSAWVLKQSALETQLCSILDFVILSLSKTYFNMFNKAFSG